MQTEVRGMLGGRTDKDALIMRGLQFAQDTIAKLYNFAELQTDDTVTLSSTGDGNELTDATISFPITMHKIHGLGIQESDRVIPLDGINVGLWEQLIGDSGSYGRGKPDRFFQRHQSVTVWRPPDSTYTIRRVYDNWPTAIVLNTAKDAPNDLNAVSDLDHKDDLIIIQATVWAYTSLNNREQANYFFAIFKDKIGIDSIDEQSKPVTVQSTTRTIPTSTDHTVPIFGGK